MDIMTIVYLVVIVAICLLIFKLFVKLLGWTFKFLIFVLLFLALVYFLFGVRISSLFNFF
ncbi:hypothetical protein HOB06_01325 [archaeon]|nr:hypothetical protein [archaeon]